MERGTAALLRLLLLASAAAPLAGCGRFEPVTAAQLDRGYVLLLPGVANKPSSMAGIAGGLRDAGIDCAIERDLWGSRPFGELRNVQSLERNRKWAAERAGRLAAYQRSHPKQPITLIGYSGGGAIALFVCESLPMDVKVDRLILLAAAVSPDYDLGPRGPRAAHPFGFWTTNRAHRRCYSAECPRNDSGLSELKITSYPSRSDAVRRAWPVSTVRVVDRPA